MWCDTTASEVEQERILNRSKTWISKNWPLLIVEAHAVVVDCWSRSEIHLQFPQATDSLDVLQMYNLHGDTASKRYAVSNSGDQNSSPVMAQKVASIHWPQPQRKLITKAHLKTPISPHPAQDDPHRLAHSKMDRDISTIKQQLHYNPLLIHKKRKCRSEWTTTPPAPPPHTQLFLLPKR
jgi:hypothetical protein